MMYKLPKRCGDCQKVISKKYDYCYACQQAIDYIDEE